MPINIEYDSTLVKQIADRYDLRKPNRDALDAVAQAIADAHGEYQEMVADMATGVGKTWLMSALIEYLATKGVRHVLVVTPGSTIQRKTLENFDAASTKYVSGGEITPFIITPSNFQSGATASALHDDSKLKVFVFNIQILLSPTTKANRRVHMDDENLGGPLYDYLESVSDLFIISDEHHIYHDHAVAFHAAIDQLHPQALVGLTATPDPSTYDKLVFQYTLAEAIADKYVKVPVIVYRKGGIPDETTQLRDACYLLEKKEAAYAVYREAHPNDPDIKPCLFIVCRNVSETQRIGALLAEPGFIGDGAAILEITNQSTDDALELLANVEQPTSPIRAILSVNMLKEGWDVRNIAVIVGVRKLASETLTEQILGRGLRLPFGHRTDIPAIDQVDIVAHDSWEDLLRQKDSLAMRIEAPDDSETGDEPLVFDDTATGGKMLNEHPASSTYTEPATDTGSGQVAVIIEEFDERESEPSPRNVYRTQSAPQIIFPRRERRAIPMAFDITAIPLSDARAAGSKFTQELTPYLFRKELQAKRDSGDSVKVSAVNIKPEQAQQALSGIDTVTETLRSGILNFPEVIADGPTLRGALELVKNFLIGAGVTEKSASDGWGEMRILQAKEALRSLVRAQLSKNITTDKYEFVPVTLPERDPFTTSKEFINVQQDPEYRLHTYFTGWQKSIMPFAMFDAKTTEWELARIMDEDPDIQWWLRLYTNDSAFIQMPNGSKYYPDFVAIDHQGTYWLIEGKSDDEARKNQDVKDKKAEAEKWVRAVAYDDHKWGTWHYLFATETVIKTSGGTWDGLIKAANPE